MGVRDQPSPDWPMKTNGTQVVIITPGNRPEVKPPWSESLCGKKDPVKEGMSREADAAILSLVTASGE